MCGDRGTSSGKRRESDNALSGYVRYAIVVIFTMLILILYSNTSSFMDQAKLISPDQTCVRPVSDLCRPMSDQCQADVGRCKANIRTEYYHNACLNRMDGRLGI